MLQEVNKVSVGCDPEFFLSQGEKIVGSERAVPEGGLHMKSVVRDGVQVELNPRPAYSVVGLGKNIGAAFAALDKRLGEVRFAGKQITMNLASVVDVTREELDSLSDKSRVFGCDPSRNVYGQQAPQVDASEYLKRAGGGHVHLGGLPACIYDGEGIDERRRLIPLADVLLGNSCVLLNPDPGQVERRKNYGRAGEYRIQPHGIEYRTLSNFWLRNHILMSFVAETAKMCVAILATTILKREELDLERALLEKVDFSKIVEAINTNNADLALENFRAYVAPFLKEYVGAEEGWYPLHKGNIKAFEKIAAKIQKGGLEKVFKENPVSHWVKIGTGLEQGKSWSEFCQ